VPDGPPDTQPQTPRIGGRSADADSQRAKQGASGEEHRTAVELPVFSTVEPIEHLPARHAESHIEREIPDRQQILHFPQIARAGQPVAVDTQFALFEAREAVRAAYGERTIFRQFAVEIRATREREPYHVTTHWQRHADSQLRALPVSIATHGAVALKVLERHGHSASRIERRIAAVEFGKQVQAGVGRIALGHECWADVHVDFALVVEIADPGLTVTTYVCSEIELGHAILEIVTRHALVIDEHVFQRARQGQSRFDEEAASSFQRLVEPGGQQALATQLQFVVPLRSERVHPGAHVAAIQRKSHVAFA
jgi:hypothetical protein